MHAGCTVALVEGEFDVLVLYAQVGELLEQHHIVPVATGSTQGAHLMRWVVRMATGQRVLVAFGADEPGDAAATWWLDWFGSKARRLKPTAHDVSDTFATGHDLKTWLLSALVNTS